MNMVANGATVVKEEVFMLQPEYYGLIAPSKANRFVGSNDSHVKKLAKSMRENGFNKDKPIIVGSNGEIKAGHNRYAAAQLVQCPIYVKVNDSYDLTQQTKQDDINKKWSSEDFIRLYSGQEKQVYLDLNRIIQAYPNFPIKIIIASCSAIGNQASGNIFNAVRTGDFEFANGMDRLAVELELDEIQKLHDMMSDEFRPKNNAISMHVGLAYLWLKGHSNFDKKRFEKMVAKNQSKLVPQAGGTRANRKKLCSIYNAGLHNGSESQAYIDPLK